MKILFITDEVERRNRLIELFTENIRNVECLEAITGTESLHIAKKHAPDFVFLDTR